MIRFYGNKDDGYTASENGNMATVVKVEGGWSASFNGNPQKRNPVVVDPDTGMRSQSCMCPLVKVEGVFKNRRLAAEAGIAAYKAERA